MSKKSVKTATKKKIIQLIYESNHPFKSREIAEKLGIAHKTARKHLLDLERLGILSAETYHENSALLIKFYKPAPNVSLEEALDKLEKFYNKQPVQDEEKGYFSAPEAEQVAERQSGTEEQNDPGQNKSGLDKSDEVAGKTSDSDFHVSVSHESPHNERHEEPHAEKPVKKKNGLESILRKLYDREEHLIKKIERLGDKLLHEYTLAVNPLKGDTSVYEEKFNRIHYVDFTSSEEEARYSVRSLRRHFDSLQKARYRKSPYHINVAFGESFLHYHWELIEEISKKVLHWFVFSDTAEVVLYEKGFNFVNVILEKEKTDLGFAWMLDLSRFPRLAVEASSGAVIPIRATLLSMFQDIPFSRATFLPLGAYSGQGLAVKPLRGNKSLVTWFGINRTRHEPKLLTYLDGSDLPFYKVSEIARSGFIGLMDRKAEETVRQTASIMGEIYVIDKDQYTAEIFERLSINYKRIPAHKVLPELEIDNVLNEKLRKKGINFYKEKEIVANLKKELEEVKNKIRNIEKALREGTTETIEESLDEYESMSRGISL